MIRIRPLRPIAASLMLLASVAAYGAADNSPDVGPLLTLDQAIRLALENNQDIKVEAYAPPIARANWVEALGQFDPALNFGRNYSVNYSYPNVPQPLPTEVVDADNYSLNLAGTTPIGLNYTIGGYAENERGAYNHFTNNYESFAGFGLTQPLLRGFGLGANLVNVRVARANRSISEWEYRQTMITTVASVVTAYSSLVLAHDNLAIARESLDLGETLVTESLQRLKVGYGSRSDVTTARATAAQRVEAIILDENTVRIDENDLRELIGEKSFPPGQPPLRVEASSAPDLPIDPVGDFRTALDNRPDYQAARLGIVINQANNAAARNGLLPQVNLVWSYGYNGLADTFAASRHMVASEDYSSSSIGVNLSIPITNAQARGRARAARLTLEQSEASLQDLEANIALSIANAASTIRTARERVVADRAAVDLASQALKDENKKLIDGKSTPLAVIQAQTILIGTNTSLASALASERSAAANYEAALGTILRQYNVSLSDIK
jgi:outer membrane protein